MIPPVYLQQLKTLLGRYFATNQQQLFIFGSALKHKHFADIDVGILSPVDSKNLEKAAEEIRASNFPFFVDLVDFSQAQDPFKSSVLNDQTKQWI